MPEKKVKDLYMGKTMDDLKHYFDLSKLGQRKPLLLCKSAQKLYSEAEKFQKEGDEELCYVTLMKYLGIVTKIRQSKEYREDKKYFTDMLGANKANTAIEWAERLSKSLEIRYELMKDSEVPKLADKVPPEFNTPIDLNNGKSTNGLSNLVNHEEKPKDKIDLSISCIELYKLLVDSNTSIMIFDVRPLSDYMESHIKLVPVLNVPEDIVQEGMSAGKLKAALPDEAKVMFEKRKLVDFVVLLDWFSLDHNLPSNNKLSILKTILTQWDPEVVYKHTPVILKGGYQEWLDTYPIYTTNSNVLVPMRNSVDSVANLLNKIEYLDFDITPEAKPASPPANHLQDGVHTPKMPTIDRSSKPYASNWKSNSGSNVSLDKTPRQTVPNSKSDVSINTDETVGDNLSDGIHIANNSNKQYLAAESRSSNSQNLPVVDRSSKALALKKFKEKEQEITKILRKQEESTDRSLELTQERVKTEDEWEKIRLKKEMEADKDIKSFLQDQEEQLLQEIVRLEKERDVMDEENKSLRKALESMRKEKEQGESMLPAPSVEIADIEQRIHKKEEARISLEKKRKEDAEKRQKELEKARATKPTATSAKTAFVPLKDESTSGPSGQMKRSHSFPNLAQMVDDETVSVKQRVPKYDRAIKPVEKAQAFELDAARQRSWHATYGRAAQGLTGLKNLGNSCYMNSIIQCISNTNPLVFYFVEGRHHNDINNNAKTSGSVVEEVAAVVRKLWSGQYRSFAAYDLKTVLGQLKSSFKGTEQQDSHEFLTLVMDWLHEELNKKSGMSPKVSKSLAKLPPSVVEWEKFRSNNDSIIQELFFGQQTSTVTCCTCSKQSVTYEPFSTLSLPLPSSISKCTLQECLRLYLREETLSGWNCPSCKESRDAVKKFDILRFPEVLVIHLKRFQHDGWSRKKQMMVDFPVENLNMKEFTSHPEQLHTIYNLYAVSNHYGTMEGGHYTAFCHNHAYRKWVKFDDQEVSDMSQNDVRTMAAYILFYESTNSNVCSVRDFDK